MHRDPSNPLQGLRLLLVDDDAEIRELFSEELRYAGAEVTSAGDTQEALSCYRNDRNLRVVMSDLRMPRGDGMSLLRAIKELGPPQPVFVMMTGYSELAPETAAAEGVGRIFEKPLDWELLIAYLQSVLNQG